MELFQIDHNGFQREGAKIAKKFKKTGEKRLFPRLPSRSSRLRGEKF
jgi:hypothetical protein